MIPWFLLALAPLLLAAGPAGAPDGAEIYRAQCASCHGLDRTGGMGPALLPDNLGRLSPRQAVEVIAHGRAATQMPGYAEALSQAEIRAVADFILKEPAERPNWTLSDVRRSHIVTHPTGSLPDRPVFKADPMNVFLVVEGGSHHVTVLDGDTFEPITRFQSRFALHGGPKFTRDGRYVFFASRDGWITKYDLYNLKVVAEIRAGLNTRNLAISEDGRTVAVGNYLPRNVLMLNGDDLSPLQSIPARDASGALSRVSAVYQAAPRKSFVVALKDAKEVWEIPYDDARRVTGWVHEHGAHTDALAAFPVRRLAVPDYQDDFFFDQSYRYLVGATRGGKSGIVLDLDADRLQATLDLQGMPHLASGITWEYRGRPVLATPNIKRGVVTIIDMRSWKTIKEIPTLGPGYFIRSHENTPYAWVDTLMGPRKDTMQIIDKRTLEVVREVTPEPGRASSHVEFTRTGSHALVSVWEHDGALVVYDARTFKEVKRLPMCKPIGKYNVYNKVHRSAGTSH